MTLKQHTGLLALIGLAWMAIVAAAGCSGSHDADVAVSGALKKQLDQGVRLFRRPTVDIDDIQPLARAFYRNREFVPAWVSARGATDDAKQLMAAIAVVPDEGLDRASYGWDSIQVAMKEVEAGMIGKAPDAVRLAALDLRLTRTFLALAAHLALGQVNPKQIPADWHVPRPEIDLVATLNQALERHRVRDALLEDLPPEDERYGRLRDALKRYRAIAEDGGWPAVSSGPSLRRGQRGERVKALQDRLAASGDLSSEGRGVFDPATEAAVRQFQVRHGLEPSGVVGAEVLAAMNVPVERRMNQIELNMERWRWRHEPIEGRYLMVNIPDFSLQVVDDHRTVLAMRVVVGKQFTRTPIFSDEITYLVLNPFWNITQNIAANEMLPLVQKEDDYLERHSIRVFDGPGEDASEVDPRKVNWGSMTPEEFTYYFRQEPGPENPLGRIKFMCPNQFDVYLHDTSAGHLFSAQERDFSHGCVRLEKPVELAEYLLNGRPDGDHAGILSALEASRDSSVRLPRPIPVHIVYWTAWVDAEGGVQFRDDVYEFDRVLDRALGRAGTTAYQFVPRIVGRLPLWPVRS